MNNVMEPQRVRPEVIQAMRERALHGGRVRDLVREAQTRLDYPHNAILPVLLYFKEAFCLPLAKVMPLREWLGTENDSEIDALLLPAIASTRSRWCPSESEPPGRMAVPPAGELGLTASKQRG